MVVWGLAILGIVASLFALPPLIAVPIGVLGVFLAWLVQRIIYLYPYRFLHAGWELLDKNNELAWQLQGHCPFRCSTGQMLAASV